MAELAHDSGPIDRRRLLGRGAAVAAGAAAGAVALGVAGTAPAAATDGQNLTQGETFTGTSTTGLTVSSTSTAPLTLANDKGPALRLTSLGTTFDGDLDPGAIVAVDDRLVVGGTDTTGAFTAALATLDDINSLYLPYAFAPVRIADTRNEAGRANILAVGGTGLDSSNRLRAGAYIDVAVDPADQDFDLSGAFITLTSTGATANGYLVAYPANGARPSSSTVNYSKGVTIAGSTIVTLGVVDDYFAVRVFSASVSHVIVDLTGELVALAPGPSASTSAARTTRRQARRSVARRTRSWTPRIRR